jgi:hypothetical protein
MEDGERDRDLDRRRSARVHDRFFAVCLYDRTMKANAVCLVICTDKLTMDAAAALVAGAAAA